MSEKKNPAGKARNTSKYPSRQDFKSYFRRLPRWVIALILALLFGRFVIIALWHW
ncbi:MAG: hypothetical protein PVJ53_07180 [Desulfobacterales bacterium]|jgi:hypothetical protein